jgi:uncharacterized protein YdaU (DUF1376 family)
MHYYKRNIGDYAKKCGRLSMLQHGAYTLLIDSCYDREKFPTLEEAIEWTWASTEAEIEAVKFVLSRFFKLGGDGQYVQERIFAELLDYHAKADVNKRIALERETKRREKSTKRAPRVNEAPPNQEPRTINQEPETKNQDIDKPAKSVLVNLFHGVSDEVKNDFIALRKAKKAPVTATAIKGIEREAIKAKLTLEQALEFCCSNGFTGFKADWIKKNTKQAESFYERDQRLAAERIAEIGTGLVAAKPSTWTPPEIDDDGTFIPF